MASKAQEFLTSGTFTVPAGVSGVKVTMTGGGGGGSASYQGQNNNAAPGGTSAELRVRFPVLVTPGAGIAVIIGAGGNADNDYHGGGTNGGATSFGAVQSLGGRGSTIGGGIRGGVLFDANLIGNYGDLETPCDFGGSGGSKGGLGFGAIGTGMEPGYAGQGAPGRMSGGAGGAPNTVPAHKGGGGGGGAATIWGTGGAGGVGGATGGSGHGTSGDTGGHPATGNGNPAPTTSYGAGGGGAGGCAGAYNLKAVWGGPGAPGYCLVEWNE